MALNLQIAAKNGIECVYNFILRGFLLEKKKKSSDFRSFAHDVIMTSHEATNEWPIKFSKA